MSNQENSKIVESNNIEENRKEPDKKFVVDTRAIYRNPMSLIRVENDYYQASLYYYGDYKQDFANGCLDATCLGPSVYEKRFVLPLAIFKNKVFISTSTFDLIALDKVENYVEKLRIAEECAISLQNIVNEYYPADKIKELERRQ